MKEPPICYLGRRSFHDPHGGKGTNEEDPNDGVGAGAAGGVPAADDSAMSSGPDSLPEPGRRPAPSADRYALEPDPGHCEAAITRYYYDRDEKRCVEFLWGGCGGVVPFETLDECEAGLPLLDLDR